MGFRLDEDESLAQGVRRIACEQRDHAVDSLRRPPDHVDVDIDERIHDARKCFKKVRAVARLVRDDVGDDVYSAINATFRDAGRLLSDVREAAVNLETLDELRSAFEVPLDDEAFAGLRERLEARHRDVRACAEGIEARARAVAMVAEPKPPIAEWPVTDDGFEPVADGLARVYRRGLEGYDRSLDDPRTEHLHDWRKRVKYLWYHTRLLAAAWPEVLEPLADELHELANDLGDDHDLAVLARLVRGEPELADARERDVLLGLIGRRRRHLQAAAFDRAQRLYAEDEGAFVDRMGAYVEAWTV